jgi:hypothetical protein
MFNPDLKDELTSTRLADTTLDLTAIAKKKREDGHRNDEKALTMKRLTLNPMATMKRVQSTVQHTRNPPITVKTTSGLKVNSSLKTPKVAVTKPLKSATN